ncbi:ATP-dependent DNA ligase [Miniimonas arenae]|uniref:DNA ligase (ATP) n=1 Tax=Miniimonas arenae TaxID=676201 RepID=A0A5C5BDX7_9MICO|nr:non-homologous end-joining DNA ligase [Miniimonas arenae]TNU76686.1 ATP-dependent DNA ligase [Miniimonas arenae]
MPDGVARLVRVGERTVRLTNPEKVLFPGDPDAGIGPTTKAELVEYYWRIAPVLLPHLAGRPVTRKRWPHGTGEGAEPFFTKNLDSGTPDWVPRAAVVHHERTVDYPLVDEVATLVWCAQMAAIELHVPQWRLPADVLAGRRPYSLDAATAAPDRLVVDLDPGPGVGLAQCCEVALAARELLDGMGLVCVPVTSGSKGLHLYARLEGVGAAGASAFAAELAESLAAELPALAITQMKRSLREGRVFVDHTQNNPAKTTVSPYSVRGRLQPWVAAPRTWAEIEEGASGGGEGGSGSLRHLRMAEVLERVLDGDAFAPLLPPGEAAGEVARDDVGDGPGGVGTSDDGTLDGKADGDTPRARKAGSPARSTTPARSAAPPPAPPAPSPRATAKATARRRPTSVPPMLASTYDPITHGDLELPRWTFETKWDGYRAVVSVLAADDGDGDGAQGDPDAAVWFTARSGRDLTPEFADLAHAPDALQDHDAVLDAEIIALDDDGRPSFHRLQNRAGPPKPPLRLVVFDVLALDGVDLVTRPLAERRAVLAALDLPVADPRAGIGEGEGGWFVSPVHDGTLVEALAADAAADGEGVLAKRADSPYLPGKRTGAWVKVKHHGEARVVIGGWRPGQGRREGGIGSLLLGVREPGGDLRYVGKVGTGFSDAELDRLLTELSPLRRATSPFAAVPREEARVAVWVEPTVVGEVTFDSWTPDGVLRAARWSGQVSD